MGRRLPDEAVHRIIVRLNNNEPVPAIASAVKVSKQTVYNIQLNIDLWGTPYAPPTVKQGRPRLLLPDQELVI
jgi:transposase